MEKTQPDWKIHLFDDQKCIDFLEKTYGTIFKDIFNYIKDGPIKSDFWQSVFYINGGLYVDADIEPIKPLSSFINNSDDFVTCISSNSFKRNLTLLLPKINGIVIHILFILKKKIYLYLNFALINISNIITMQSLIHIGDGV